MRALAGIGLVMMLALPVAAQPYDDPAVAVCEFILLGGKPAPEHYQRTGAAVSGLQVTIDYTYEVLNVEPKPRQSFCNFKVNDDGTFSPEVEIRSPESDKCGARIEEISSQPGLADLPEDEKAQLRSELERCSAVLRRQSERGMSIMADIVLPLETMGLFSIAQENTQLRAQ